MFFLLLFPDYKMFMYTTNLILPFKFSMAILLFCCYNIFMEEFFLINIDKSPSMKKVSNSNYVNLHCACGLSADKAKLKNRFVSKLSRTLDLVCALVSLQILFIYFLFYFFKRRRKWPKTNSKPVSFSNITFKHIFKHWSILSKQFAVQKHQTW